MDRTDYSLLCPFLNDDPVFAQGVAFGLLWAELRDPDRDEIAQYVLNEIEEQVRVAASRTGWEIVELKPWVYENEETGWVFIRMARRPDWQTAAA